VETRSLALNNGVSWEITSFSVQHDFSLDYFRGKINEKLPFTITQKNHHKNDFLSGINCLSQITAGRSQEQRRKKMKILVIFKRNKRERKF
jgi:hypothetical protein